MSTSELLKKAMDTVPGCFAAGYVDLDTGMMMGANTTDSHPSEVIDSVAAATKNLFQGANVMMIEEMFKASRGESVSHCFEEYIVLSDKLVHLFLRAKEVPDHVICFVCRKGASLDTLLDVSRKAVGSVMDELMAPLRAAS